MFSEYRDLIQQVRANDPHFADLFDRHDQLDRQIKDMESHVTIATHEEIETAKKQKLLLKDEVYVILRRAMDNKS